jgi:3-hydroxybutyrate dehydrogenase/3-oxoacyl-[acyl-carrier protein] reductase
MLELDGKVALVTGGTRGIGRAIAEIFQAQGARVMINGKSREKGAQALAEMDAGDRCDFFPADIRSKQGAEDLVDATIGRFGKLDILVNNAGGSGGFGLVHELTDEAWQGTADWTLNSAFWTTRRALQHMVERGEGGRIINISSVEGKQAAKAAVSPYIVFKHALNGFTKAVAFEYGTMGITSNAICPGAIETDLMKEAGPDAAKSMGITYEQFLDNYAQESMIKRLNRVEEVAAMALILASELGSGITGALINVDGGSAAY